LTQQVVAETACEEYTEDALFAVVRRAWPFRDLDRREFDAVVAMAAEGFATRRGRRSALIHRDEVHGRLRGRRGSRLLALTSGGAIPEVADYRVILDPDDTFIGTLNEDFAIESTSGDVFQLGNAAWRVLQVAAGTVRVADAHGAPPNLPFWLGEAPARSDELSRAVSDLRADMEGQLQDCSASVPDNAGEEWLTGSILAAPADAPSSGMPVAAHGLRTCPSGPVNWLIAETGLAAGAAEQIVAYLDEARRALGVLPTQHTLVLERFFDESGGMQLVLHAPFGSRVNRAWGLALRKRFCRQFNFELQAAATEDALLLSLGPQHSFPLADVFRYLHPATAREVLVQAFLDAPVFQSRWRWNTTIALAVPRHRGGKKVPPQLQRMLADDLMAAVFPDAAACLENIPGDRRIPDHPLVAQTVRDCLHEAMDFDRLAAVLTRIHAGEIRLVSCDRPEPSPLAHEILNARPYAFLDDAPLEERRAHAVYARRANEPSMANELGALDASAIERVRDEVRPDPRDADEMHDALLTAGVLADGDVGQEAAAFLEQLSQLQRAGRLTVGSGPALWVAAERLPELTSVHQHAHIEGSPVVPPLRRARQWSRAEALVELLRGRMTVAGPTTAQALAATLCVPVSDIEAALLELEGEGVVLRGAFTGRSPGTEWCDRRLLARIHRYTLNRLRAEIEPVSPADFMRFLFAWQHVDARHKLTGIDGLREALASLDGFELPAAAWERAVLPARLDRYEPAMLDMLCLTGEVGWARFSTPTRSEAPGISQLGAMTPVALFLHEHGSLWQSLRGAAEGEEAGAEAAIGGVSREVLDVVRRRGASFSRELAAACSLDDGVVADALGELVAAGLITSDGFAGLRAIVRPVGLRPSASDPGRTSAAGRWSVVRAGAAAQSRDHAVEAQAWSLLRRYGVVFRRVLTREANAVPWRELARVYRRLEARGEIRGGRFVSGMSGEQFAVPDAIARMREIRRTSGDQPLVTISAADPLNLTGIITSGERVRAVTSSRIVYRHGSPIAALEGDYMRALTSDLDALSADVATALAGRRMPAVAGGFIGRAF
jgi:ATP-dependent Lhr-like helicase